MSLQITNQHYDLTKNVSEADSIMTENYLALSASSGMFTGVTVYVHVVKINW